MSTSKQCRIYFHVQIERLLSQHFGRTQHFTLIGSHNIDGDENSENKYHYSQTITWLDQQAMHFTDEQDEYHNESDEIDGRQFCSDVMADDVSINL